MRSAIAAAAGSDFLKRALPLLFRAAVAGALFLLLALGPGASAADPKPVVPRPQDKCPVCGMFVAKFPDFAAQIVYADGGYAVFDGVKDLLRYSFDLARYAPTRKAGDIAAIYVTDYYRLTPVDGRRAFYVPGSDVYGPMGKELVPFAKEEDARVFLADHKGKAVLPFRDITPAVLKELE